MDSWSRNWFDSHSHRPWSPPLSLCWNRGSGVVSVPSRFCGTDISKQKQTYTTRLLIVCSVKYHAFGSHGFLLAWHLTVVINGYSTTLCRVPPTERKDSASEFGNRIDSPNTNKLCYGGEQACISYCHPLVLAANTFNGRRTRLHLHHSNQQLSNFFLRLKGRPCPSPIIISWSNLL
jgi:hypothetical protein